MSGRHYKQLQLQDREAIEEGLKVKKPISAIAQELEVSPSTITREILRNRRDDGYKGVTAKSWGNANRCKHRMGCELKSLCKQCTSPDSRYCSFCKKSKCMDRCGRYEEEVCPQISGSPHVCNGCSSGTCRLHRYRYSASAAQHMTQERARESREGIDCSPEDLERAEVIIRAGLEKGQGLDHIYSAHAESLVFSKSSFYRYVRHGNISIIPMDLRRAVKYKLRDKKTTKTRSNIPKEILEGRTHADFLALDEEVRARVVQCDCVEGPSEEKSALLTLHFVSLHFQLVFKLKAQDTKHVMECFNWLATLLEDDFASYFGILLFDRGSEFAHVCDIELLADKGAIKVYFADPQRPDQKGAAEKNHVEIRKVIEKGSSLEGIDARVLSEVMSHVNSSLRCSLFGKSPMELAMSVLPHELFEEMGYRLIAPKDVMLIPKLLDIARSPS